MSLLTKSDADLAAPVMHPENVEMDIVSFLLQGWNFLNFFSIAVGEFSLY